MDTIVDLQNQADWATDLINYLSTCNRALVNDCAKLEMENKVLKAQFSEALVVHEKKVVVEERKVIWGRL